MTGLDEHNPTSWGVLGNLVNTEIGEPESTTPFTPSNCSLTLGDPVLIDGHTLTPLKVESDWP
jgi:hypothetical protein